MKRKLIIALSWVAVAACMAVIFALSAQNGSDSQIFSDSVTSFLGFSLNVVAVIRKAAHFLEFAGLAVLVYNAIYQTIGTTRPIISFIVTAVYALSDEIHQIFVNGRACRLFDLFVDCMGAICGLIGITLIIFIASRIKARKVGANQGGV